jgi:hypothetical protein
MRLMAHPVTGAHSCAGKCRDGRKAVRKFIIFKLCAPDALPGVPTAVAIFEVDCQLFLNHEDLYALQDLQLFGGLRGLRGLLPTDDVIFGAERGT